MINFTNQILFRLTFLSPQGIAIPPLHFSKCIHLNLHLVKSAPCHIFRILSLVSELFLCHVFVVQICRHLCGFEWEDKSWCQCRLGTAVPLCLVGSPEPSVDVSLENSCSTFVTFMLASPVYGLLFNAQNPSSISFHCCIGIFCTFP